MNKTVAITLAYDLDDNFNNISNDTDYFKKEEGVNELIEECFKKFEVIILTKVDDDNDVYFYSENEKKKVMNKEMQKKSTIFIPLVHSSDNFKKEMWFDEDIFFNEMNLSKVNTVTSHDMYFDKANDICYNLKMILQIIIIMHVTRPAIAP